MRLIIQYATAGPMILEARPDLPHTSSDMSRSTLFVKNTFIEYTEEPYVGKRSSSAPPLRGVAAGVESAHARFTGTFSKETDWNDESEQSTCDNDYSHISESLYGSEDTHAEIMTSQEAVVETSLKRATWSIGAIGHANGSCKPCAWNWKPSGCTKGHNCEFCHLCEDGVVKFRKKERLHRRKEMKIPWNRKSQSIRNSR
mmetsp:Transcript_92753/g.145703  ORF Transcript_92753/g.145703 Transcript_92753/m.145703 type:complete len:200 (-) Transcript_92753:130-729(-)